jgi:hypothetical protein
MRQKEIKDYNEDLKKFDNYIQEILIQLFGKENFKAFIGPVMPTVKNTMGRSELLRMLNRCWREEGFSFNLGYAEGHLKTNNATTIAKVPKDGERWIKESH